MPNPNHPPADPYCNLPPRLVGWIKGQALQYVPEQILWMCQNIQAAQALEELALRNSNQQGPDGAYLIADETNVLAGILWAEVAKRAAEFGTPGIEAWAEYQASEAVERGRMYADAKAHARKTMANEQAMPDLSPPDTSRR